MGKVCAGVLLGCVAISLFFFACSPDTKEECVFIPEVKTKVEIGFEPLSDSLVALSSKQELVEFFGRNQVLRDYFFQRSQYPNDSVFINTLFKKFTHPYFDTLRVEVRKVFGNEKALKLEFEQAFGNLKYYYPDVKVPRIQTVITGLDNDMFVSDSLIIVSLDYFMGAGARYRPNMYDYLLRQYNKENIVPSIMLVIGMNRFNQTNLEDKTVLADMVAYGKAYYFAKHMHPCVPDSTLIWYSAKELQGAKENQDLIWHRLIEDQVLYSTSHITKQRFLGERPVTIEVGEKCPGRIAQWVGWEIVKSFMQVHPNTSLPELMRLTDADKIFKESKYKPVKR